MAATRCGRVRSRGVHGHDGAWPSRSPEKNCAQNAHKFRREPLFYSAMAAGKPSQAESQFAAAFLSHDRLPFAGFLMIGY